MECNINSAGKNPFIGDFNIHVKDQSNFDTRNFQDVLDSLRLINYITFDTHHLENKLDLVITSVKNNFIRNPYQGCLFSDHNIVFFDITSNRAKAGLLGLILQFSPDACVNFITPHYNPCWIYMLP